MNRKALSLYFSKKPAVLAAYLFGSATKDVTKPGDIDIAVLLSREVLKKNDVLDLEIDLEREISKLIHSPKIDLVVLNNASSLLRHEVLKSKDLLYQRDEKSRLDFEVTSELEFYDFQPYRKLFWEALVKRIEKGRLGSV